MEEKFEKYLEEIYKALAEANKTIDRITKRQEEMEKGLRELRESQKETDRLIKELRESQKETDKQIKELRESQKETDKQIKELRESQKETDEQLKETDKRIERLSEEIRKIGKQVRDTTKAVSELNGVWQNYTEDTIREGLENALKGLGFRDFSVRGNMTSRKDGESMEIDGLVLGEDYVIVLEVKTTLKVEDVRRFVEKLKGRFLYFFPEYKGFRLYGAIAGMRFQENADSFASRNGLIVLKHKDGEDVKVLNPEGFKPKDFSKV